MTPSLPPVRCRALEQQSFSDRELLASQLSTLQEEKARLEKVSVEYIHMWSIVDMSAGGSEGVSTCVCLHGMNCMTALHVVSRVWNDVMWCDVM